MRRRMPGFVKKEPNAGGKDADDAGLRAEGGGLHGRFHADERHVRILRPKRADGGRGGRVAGYDDDIGTHPQQNLRDGAGAVLDVFRRFLSVRAMRVVRKIDVPLVREQFYDLAVNRQAAGAGIEYADGCHSLTNIREKFVFLYDISESI